MSFFSFKPKRQENPNPNFRPPATEVKIYQNNEWIDWGEYIAHLNNLLTKKEEHISKLLKERYWKDKLIRQLKSENEKLKDIIRGNKVCCEVCKGHDEKSPNYGYTEYCEDCFWYPWADEEKCPNKWELKE